MQELTVTQLVDILFQKPDRITKDVLSQRSAFQKVRDKVLTYDQGTSPRNAHPGTLEKLKHKLLLHFESCATVSPHERSLKNAALELKALGFSNPQVEEIKHLCHRFVLEYFEPGRVLEDVLKIDHPGYFYAWCDDAFFGAALAPDTGVGNSTTKVTKKDFLEATEQREKNMHNPILTKNSAFSTAREEQAYPLFQEYIVRNWDVYQGGNSAFFLKPFRPTQICKDIRL